MLDFEKIETAASKSIKLQDVRVLMIPSVNFFVFVMLAGYGMMLTPASVAFMTQASCIIFTAGCSTLLLNRKLNRLHIKGIAAVMIGVGVVAIAGTIYSERAAQHSKTTQPGDNLVGGIVLTLASQLAQALQFVTEEKLLGQTNLDPMQVMGIEGLLSTFLSCAALWIAQYLPGHDYGGYFENSADTMVQLVESPVLVGCCVANVLSVAGANYFGLRVSVNLGSVFRTVLLSLRTLLIWAANLALFYMHIGGGHVGEHWDSIASPIEMVGFAVLLLGTVLYSQGSSAVAQSTRIIVDDIREVYRAISLDRTVQLSPLAPRGAGAPPSPFRDIDEPVIHPLPVASSTVSASGSIAISTDDRELPGFWSSLRSTTPTKLSSSAVSPFASPFLPSSSSRLPATLSQTLSLPGVPPCSVDTAEDIKDLVECGSLNEGSLLGGPAPSFATAMSTSPVPRRQSSGSYTIGAHEEARLINKAVQALGAQRRMHPALTGDVEREIQIRATAQRDQISVKGTLLAATSWLLPTEAADTRQHCGASTFQNPFFPQIPAQDGPAVPDAGDEGGRSRRRVPYPSVDDSSNMSQTRSEVPLQNVPSDAPEMQFDTLFDFDQWQSTSVFSGTEESSLPEL